MQKPLAAQVATLEVAVKAQRKMIKKLRRQKQALTEKLASMPPDYSAWSEGESPDYLALVEMLEDIPRGLRTLDEVMQHVKDHSFD